MPVGTGSSQSAQLPDTVRLLDAPAVALFIAQAQAHWPDFRLTAAAASVAAAICARLDGLPLAIELAAAWVKVLPLADLLQRLEQRLPLLTGGARDLEARQQTMRATLAWSEHLLSPEHCTLFRRLAVFVGSFTVRAAEAVCATPPGAAPLGTGVLDGLAALVDSSLVQPWHEDAAEGERERDGEAVRFRLLSVVREYALEQLEAGDNGNEAAALHRAHAAYYVGLAEQPWDILYLDLPGELEEREFDAAQERLEQDHDNLRAALGWLRARAEQQRRPSRARRLPSVCEAKLPALGSGGEAPVVQGLRLAGALMWMWAMHGHLGEGRSWLEALFALDSASTTARKEARSRAISEGYVRARALYALGLLAYWQGDADQAVPPLQQSLALARTLDVRTLPPPQILNNVGMALQEQGNLEQARACYEESLLLLRAMVIPSKTGEGNALNSLALLALASGDLELAEAFSEEGLAVCRQVNYAVGTAAALSLQALIVWQRGHRRQAEALAREAVAVVQAGGDVRFFGERLEVYASICAALGQAERAARLLGAAAAFRERIGMRRSMEIPASMAAAIASVVGVARAGLGEEAWAAAHGAGRALSVEAAIAEALGDDEQ